VPCEYSSACARLVDFVVQDNTPFVDGCPVMHKFFNHWELYGFCAVVDMNKTSLLKIRFFTEECESKFLEEKND